MNRRPAGWLPTDAHRRTLLEFEGYGADQPRVVFVGLEERCDQDRSHQEDNIFVRCTHGDFSRRLDKNHALRLIARLLPHYQGFLRPGGVPVWNYMARIMAVLRGAVVADQGPKVAREEWHSAWQGAYERLGTVEDGTFLTELLPLPRPGRSTWRESYIPSFFPMYARNVDYMRDAWPDRQPFLRTLFAGEHIPSFAFCYGTGEWDRYESLFQMSPTAPPPQSLRTDEHGTWHVLRDYGESPCIKVGRTEQGTVVAMTGFYGVAANKIRYADIPDLVAAMRWMEAPP